MAFKFKWKKSVFSNKVSLYSGDKPVGKLVDKMFREAHAELNANSYIFYSYPYSRNYDIVDEKTGDIVGKIDTYASKDSILIIDLKNKKEYRYTGSTGFQNRWKITSEEDEMALSTGTYTEGEILSEFDNDMLISTGVFLNHSYWQYDLFIASIYALLLFACFT